MLVCDYYLVAHRTQQPIVLVLSVLAGMPHLVPGSRGMRLQSAPFSRRRLVKHARQNGIHP